MLGQFGKNRWQIGQGVLDQGKVGWRAAGERKKETGKRKGRKGEMPEGKKVVSQNKPETSQKEA